MKYTVGIFLITNSKKILIVHPTYHNKNSWSIPKGLKDNGEDTFAAGIRELYEETNIKYEQIMHDVIIIKKMDDVKYSKNNKYLVPYFIILGSDNINHLNLKCLSMVEIDNRNPFPEVDKYMWVTFENALNVLHETQIKALNDYINYEQER